jgi:hypothetical protein
MVVLEHWQFKLCRGKTNTLRPTDALRRQGISRQICALHKRTKLTHVLHRRQGRKGSTEAEETQSKSNHQEPNAKVAASALQVALQGAPCRAHQGSAYMLHTLGPHTWGFFGCTVSAACSLLLCT